MKSTPWTSNPARDGEDHLVYPAWIAGFAGVVAGSGLMALGAQVRIPMSGTDVPMTLQSLGALLVGFCFSPGRAVAAIVLYVGCGVAGMPVFAQGSSGLPGPTGGYLVGFVAAAWLVSVLSHGRRSSILRLSMAAAFGTAVIFFFGVLWRTVWFGGGVEIAFRTGIAPFAFKALVQLVLAVTLAKCLGVGAVPPRAFRD